MNYCFEIGDIGIHLNGIRTECRIEKELTPFLVDKEKYEMIENRVECRIIECSNEKITAYVEENKHMIYTSYAHCKYAVLFDQMKWKEHQMNIFLNSDCYKEKSWGIKQLFAITGFHSALLFRGSMMLHASYIRTEDGAILFTAPSQTGKSTQADLWYRVYGAEIVNGDRSLLVKKGTGWNAYGVPMCGSSDICKNVSSKIKAIVVLGQSEENKVIKMTQAEKYKALLLGSEFYLWSKEESDKTHEIISDIISEIEIIKFVCRPDDSAVRELKRYLER